jgi:hypothetical protein
VKDRKHFVKSLRSLLIEQSFDSIDEFLDYFCIVYFVAVLWRVYYILCVIALKSVFQFFLAFLLWLVISCAIMNYDIWHVLCCAGNLIPAPSTRLDPWTFVARITPSYLVPLHFPSWPELSSYGCMVDVITLTLVLAIFKLLPNFRLGHGG